MTLNDSGIVGLKWIPSKTDWVYYRMTNPVTASRWVY